jgi:hypothetical protein
VGRIADELAAIARTGEILPGTIGEQKTRCGKPNCACHGEPPRLHGPYIHWTRKVAAKTVGRYLTAQQRDELQRWVDNGRRARQLLARLEELAVAAVEADTPSLRPK